VPSVVWNFQQTKEQNVQAKMDHLPEQIRKIAPTHLKIVFS